MNEPKPNEPTGTAVRSSELLERAMNPQEGDWLERDGSRIDIKAVADGQVHYEVTTVEKYQVSLKDWARRVCKTLKVNGTKYNARSNSVISEPVAKINDAKALE